MHTTTDRPNGAPQFDRRLLHIQVRDAIRDKIGAGKWTGALPSEQDIAASFGVSSGTTRKALDMLEAEGILTRTQGRGTFVRERVAWDEFAAETAYLLGLLGAPAPAKDPARKALVNGSGGSPRYVTAGDLRKLSAQAAEAAAWLDREALLGRRAA